MAVIQNRHLREKRNFKAKEQENKRWNERRRNQDENDSLIRQQNGKKGEEGKKRNG